MTTTTVDRLQVQVYESRATMGLAAAAHVATLMRTMFAVQDRVRMVFASAPSQVEFLAALAVEPGLDWDRVTAFHMDEYLGMPADAPQSFGRFIREHLLDRVHVGCAHFVEGAADPGDECRRYAGLLAESPIDIVCLGIGENGHIAFNDPPFADFDDPHLVKVVELDDRSRHQQVHDGCFPTFESVPRLALTMTIPALMGGRYVSAVVPAPSKAEAVRATLAGPVTDRCPATVMRRHPQAVLFLDPDSARLTPQLTGA